MSDDSAQGAEAALSPQQLGGSGRRHDVAARSRDADMIGVPTSPAIDPVGSKKGPYPACQRVVTAV